MRSQLTSTKGLSLMLLGGCIFGCWMLWVTTRIRSPIDIPISMSVGHVRTREFQVNLEATYLVEIEAETKAFPPDTLYCLLGYKITPQINTACLSTPSVVKAAWVLLSAGQTVASGSTEDKDEEGEGGAVTDHGVARVIGTFVSEKNRPYVLDIDVLADGSHLSPGNPRLKVVAFPEDRVSSYWGPRIVTASVVLELVGAIILAISLIRRRRRTIDANLVAS